MSLTPVDPDLLARALDDAHLAGRTLDVSDVLVGDLGDAYAVQHALTARRLARGDRVVGWKLGYTSQAMRAQMGVDEPNLGPLLAGMLLDDGVVGDGFTQPRVEPEVALVLSADPGPGAGVERVLECTARACAALEVVDSVWTGYRFDLEHNTADGSSAAGVVLGPDLPLAGLPAIEVELLDDVQVLGRGVGADAGGHPAAGVAWLADRLAERGASLQPGDVVITGGLTAAAPLRPGGSLRAVFRADGHEPAAVTVRRS